MLPWGSDPANPWSSSRRPCTLLSWQPQSLTAGLPLRLWQTQQEYVSYLLLLLPAPQLFPHRLCGLAAGMRSWHWDCVPLQVTMTQTCAEPGCLMPSLEAVHAKTE